MVQGPHNINGDLSTASQVFFPVVYAADSNLNITRPRLSKSTNFNSKNPALTAISDPTPRSNLQL